MNFVNEVRKKKEFSELPNSIIKRALRESDNDVKETRKLLRKYFGVFLTNKVLKRRGDLLKHHASSKKRNYEKFYIEIFRDIKNVDTVVDLGCGANGFSYEYLPGDVIYIGVEAAGQLVDYMNAYFI